jgi:hypothetical protein
MITLLTFAPAFLRNLGLVSLHPISERPSSVK